MLMTKNWRAIFPQMEGRQKVPQPQRCGSGIERIIGEDIELAKVQKIKNFSYGAQGEKIEPNNLINAL